MTTNFKLASHAQKRLLALLAGLMAMAGCGSAPEKTYPVHGLVTLDGKPIAAAWIVFEMDSSATGTQKRYAARGNSDNTGNFELTTFTAKDGAIPGQYRVAVIPTSDLREAHEKPTAPALKIPTQYTNIMTSVLRQEVQAKSNKIHLDLKS